MNTRQDQSFYDDRPDARPTIAVIDDERKWLKVFQRMFRNSDYQVEAFSDPRFFLETIEASPTRYCGIICDIQMPEMDGLQVFNAVKNNPATRNIPFLIVSGVLTQSHNLPRIQGTVFVSKLSDDLRSQIFNELIQVIEEWPKLESFLREQQVGEEDISFFGRFFINYQIYFNEILQYINQMEQACVNADTQAIQDISDRCMVFMDDLYEKIMRIIQIIQNGPDPSSFIRKICERGRSSLNMIQHFQLILSEESPSTLEFRTFLEDCRDSLERIIVGTEEGYSIRKP